MLGLGLSIPELMARSASAAGGVPASAILDNASDPITLSNGDYELDEGGVGGIDNTYATFTPVISDWIRAVQDPAGASAGPTSGNVIISEFLKAMGLPVLLGTYDQTSVAQTDITLDSGYYRYLVVGWMEPATDNVSLYGRFTDDAFLTVLSASYAYSESRYSMSSATPGITTGSGSSVMIFSQGVGNATGERHHFKFQIINADASLPTGVAILGARTNTSGDYSRHFVGSSYEGSEVINGLRLYFSSGNIDNIKAYVYGWGHN